MITIYAEEKKQYFNSYTVLNSFNFEHASWYSVHFNSTDYSNNEQRHTLLVEYKQEFSLSAYLTLISSLNTDVCLNCIHYFLKDSRYCIFFDCLPEEFIHQNLNTIKELTELRQLGFFIKILGKIIEINEKGYYFKYLELEEIFIRSRRPMRCREKVDIDDCEVRIFVKPENFYEPVKNNEKIVKTWKKKQKKLVGKLLFTLATGKILTEQIKIEQRFMELSQTFSGQGHTLQYSKIFLEFFNQGTFRTLSEISDGFASVAFNKKIIFNDSVKLLEFKKKSTFPPINRNLYIIKEKNVQNLRIKFFFSTKSLAFRENLFETGSISNKPLKYCSISSSNSLELTKHTLNLSNHSERSSRFNFVSPVDRSLSTLYNQAQFNEFEKNNFPSNFSSIHSDTPKSVVKNLTEKEIKQSNFNIGSKAHTNTSTPKSSNHRNRKCGKCGKNDSETRLECNHYIHKLCLEKMFDEKNSGSKNFSDFHCGICFTPILRKKNL